MDPWFGLWLFAVSLGASALGGMLGMAGGIFNSRRNSRRGLTRGGTFMLVLGHKPRERLVLPHPEVVVTVLAPEGNAVRLGSFVTISRNA